ncbi:MAG: phytochelatin synthase family protein [Geminicoccaceae bacterium]
MTSAGLLTAVADPSWTERAAEDGPGLRFDELVTEVTAALRAYGLERDVTVETFRPGDASPDSLARLRAVLSVNEASDRDVVLAYFNQGVLTGDWDGPHVSPLGAFDAARGRVLVMDVDREWYVPYWSPEARLLDAMLKPAPAGMGSLAGETGGLIWLKPRAGGRRVTGLPAGARASSRWTIRHAFRRPITSGPTATLPGSRSATSCRNIPRAAP